MVMAPANHEDETYIHCKKCKLLFLDASFFLIVAWLHGRADPLALSPSTQTHSRTFHFTPVPCFLCSVEPMRWRCWIVCWARASVFAFPSLYQKPTAASGCADTREECSDWAADGECEKNAGFMLTECAHSCTLCKEGQPGVARSADDLRRRRDKGCDDHDADCEARASAGECTSGTDAPLRCPASCRVCRFQKVVEEAYGCNGVLNMLSSAATCANKRRRCARPAELPPTVTPGSMGETMQRKPSRASHIAQRKAFSHVHASPTGCIHLTNGPVDDVWPAFNAHSAYSLHEWVHALCVAQGSSRRFRDKHAYMHACIHTYTHACIVCGAGILSAFPQYSPRALSQPSGEHGAHGVHGQHAPWVSTQRHAHTGVHACMWTCM